MQEKSVSLKQNFRPEGKKGMPFLMLILPVIAFYNAVRNFHYKPWRKYIVMFGVLYGLTFIPIKYSDGSRYAERFEQMSTYTISQYIHDITHFRTAGSIYPDIYAFSLFFWVGLFTRNPQIFHLVTALIYFSVYISLLGSVYDFVKSKNPKPIIWFFLGLVFILSFSAGINGVRWPLALVVFLYGTFKLIIFEKKKYLLIAGLSVFIHFAMIYGVLFLVFYQLTFKKFQMKYIYLFIIISLAVSPFLSDFFVGNLGVFGDSIESQASGYITNEEYKDMRELHTRVKWDWYVRLNANSTYYFGLFSIILISLKRQNLTFDWTSKKMEYIAFLTLGSSIMSGSLVDSISNRYLLIFNGVVMIYLFYLSSINPNRLVFKRLSYILMPLMILRGLVLLRGDLSTVSPVLLAGNPIVMLVYQAEQSIQSFLPF
jgi:hypothetical protein